MSDEEQRVDWERASGYGRPPEPKPNGMEQGVNGGGRAGREPAWGHSAGTSGREGDMGTSTPGNGTVVPAGGRRQRRHGARVDRSRASRVERVAPMQRASSVHIGSSVLRPRNEVWAGLVEGVRTFVAYVFMLVFSILWWALIFKMACGEQTLKRVLVVILMVLGYFFLLGLIIFLAVPFDEWLKESGK